MKLESRYSVDLIIFALEKYTDVRNDIPTPADIIKILTPEIPRITEAEFVAAQRWLERNNYPIFCDAQDTVDAYRRQEREGREAVEIMNEKLLSIAGSSVKRIGN